MVRLHEYCMFRVQDNRLQMDLACSMYQTNTLAMKESALLCPCVWQAWCQDKQKDLETAMNTESQQTVIIDAV